MTYHEQYQANQYDKGNICGCGRPSRHASGRCWECYSANSEDVKAIKKRLKAELARIDMNKQEGESNAEWFKRCERYCKDRGYKG